MCQVQWCNLLKMQWSKCVMCWAFFATFQRASKNPRFFFCLVFLDDTRTIFVALWFHCLLWLRLHTLFCTCTLLLSRIIVVCFKCLIANYLKRVLSKRAKYNPCIVNYVKIYFNWFDIQQMIHANINGEISYHWTPCKQKDFMLTYVHVNQIMCHAPYN
jgi:hypothetical protein